MEVDTIAGTLIVWDYQPDRGLLNPMAVYGAATPGACPLGTYVFDHQGEGVLDATWPTTITLVNGSKTFGPDTLPQAVEISWPVSCSYAPCTTSAVLTIVSSTYDVNGDVTAAQWSGGFCTTATGQITHQAVMNLNCGVITLTITRLSDGFQITDNEASWTDGQIVMFDVSGVAFTCSLTTVSFTIGHRNGETMTVDNCAACSTSSSSSSSSSLLSSSSSNRPSSSSIPSSSSSSASGSSSSSSNGTSCTGCPALRDTYTITVAGFATVIGATCSDCANLNGTFTLRRGDTLNPASDCCTCVGCIVPDQCDFWSDCCLLTCSTFTCDHCRWRLHISVFIGSYTYTITYTQNCSSTIYWRYQGTAADCNGGTFLRDFTALPNACNSASTVTVS